MSFNQAVIYSNGIADFRRRYTVRSGQPAEITIPVRRDHVADVLASLNLYGPVTLKRPPSFRPENEDESTLAIEPGNVLERLATRLCGAKVQIEKGGGSVSGTLLGLHTEEEATGGERVHPRFLVLQTDDGLRKVSFREVLRLRFEDEVVRTELDKALRRNVQQIKPLSTFIELALETAEAEAEAIVQYTIPAAAWKISYRLRQAGEGPCEFQAFAVVDNNTDEDWNDFLISVVTGEPITFSTDLAESKTPRRKHVNVVSEEAAGAVEVEEGMAMAAAPAEAATGAPLRRMRYAKRRGSESDETGGWAGFLEGAAVVEQAAAREVGDFCVFETQSPVSIGAKRSAVIPVFQTTLDRSRSVLHYKFANHAERPYRAVQFVNETPHSLGRGVCTVFRDGTFMGSCVMPATKPDGEALLPHALETAVRVRMETKPLRRRTVGLRFSDGCCHTSFHESQTIEYRIKSSSAAAQWLIVDHDFSLDDPKVICTLRRAQAADEPLAPHESLKNGLRLQLDLEPRDELTLVLVESRTRVSTIELVGKKKSEEVNAPWLADNIVVANGPLANSPGVRQCLEIQRRLDAKQAEINDATKEIERLTARQERLRKNIATGGHDDQTNEWKSDLGKAEKKLVELEDRLLPRLRDEARQVNAELRQAVLALSDEWSE